MYLYLQAAGAGEKEEQADDVRAVLHRDHLRRLLPPSSPFLHRHRPRTLGHHRSEHQGDDEEGGGDDEDGGDDDENGGDDDEGGGDEECGGGLIIRMIISAWNIKMRAAL